MNSKSIKKKLMKNRTAYNANLSILIPLKDINVTPCPEEPKFDNLKAIFSLGIYQNKSYRLLITQLPEKDTSNPDMYEFTENGKTTYWHVGFQSFTPNEKESYEVKLDQLDQHIRYVLWKDQFTYSRVNSILDPLLDLNYHSRHNADVTSIGNFLSIKYSVCWFHIDDKFEFCSSMKKALRLLKQNNIKFKVI